MSKKIPTFEAFWPFYLSQHAVPLCRQLHFVGTSLVVGLVGYAVVTGAWGVLLLCPVAGYGFAWVGHFIIEKNRPATFTYPVWSLMGDFKMFGLMLTGKLWSGVPVVPRAQEHDPRLEGVVQPSSLGSADGGRRQGEDEAVRGSGG